MNQLAVVQSKDMAKVEQALIGGDLSRLSENERISYYRGVCESLGLNPLTKPFDYITLNGRLTLYARKDCTDQLRSLKKVSIKITSRETIEGVYIVTAQAKLPDGREDESTGAVPIANLKGDVLANAMMKCETKAKRRVTLSICGLGILDETEVESIPEAKREPELPRIYPEQPMEGDGVPHDYGYRIPFGKFAKRSLEEVDPKQLGNYVTYLEKNAEKTGKPLSAQAQEFIEMASAYLGALENQPMEGCDERR